MKSEIFSEAIRNRNRIRFFYGFNEMIIDPYFISTSTDGSKVIYGKSLTSSEIKEYSYKKIVNIRILDDSHFTPIIPLIPIYN
jgi:hypothetical protein